MTTYQQLVLRWSVTDYSIGEAAIVFNIRRIGTPDERYSITRWETGLWSCQCGGLANFETGLGSDSHCCEHIQRAQHFHQNQYRPDVRRDELNQRAKAIAEDLRRAGTPRTSRFGPRKINLEGK